MYRFPLKPVLHSCGMTTGEAFKGVCNVAVVFPTEASLDSAVSSCEESKKHRRVYGGRAIYVVEYSNTVRVAMTAGYSSALEAELAAYCAGDASVLVPYPVLFTEDLTLSRGSAYRLEICKYATANNESLSLPLGANAANLVAGIFQSASPGSVDTEVDTILTSSNPRFFVLFPTSWVNRPIRVDGVGSALTPQLLFSRFKTFTVCPVAVCTGTAEKLAGASLHQLLDANDPSVCRFIRVAVMDILRHYECNDAVCIYDAIHKAGDISVPTVLLYSGGNSTQQRMLGLPRTSSDLTKNQRIMKEFFLQECTPCLTSLRDIRHLAVELIGEAALHEAEIKATDSRGSLLGRELLCQIFLQWKMVVGREIDFVPHKCV